MNEFCILKFVSFRRAIIDRNDKTPHLAENVEMLSQIGIELDHVVHWSIELDHVIHWRIELDHVVHWSIELVSSL